MSSPPPDHPMTTTNKIMPGWLKVTWEGNHGHPYDTWECWKKSFVGFITVVIFPGSGQGLRYLVKGQHSGTLAGLTTYEAAAQEIERRVGVGNL